MKKTAKLLLMAFTVLALCLTFISVGHLSGDRTPELHALTTDEAELCLLLSTPIASKTVDVAALIECIATFEN